MSDAAFLELRFIRMRNGPQADRTTAYLRDVWLPEMQKAGVGPVGIFASLIGPQNPTILTVVTVHFVSGDLAVPMFDADYMTDGERSPAAFASGRARRSNFRRRSTHIVSSNSAHTSRPTSGLCPARSEMFDDDEISNLPALWDRTGVLRTYDRRT